MAIELKRYEHNPIVTPADVPPSSPDLEVIGAFNAGAALVGDEIVLLLRVAERPISADSRRVGIPRVDLSETGGHIEVEWVDRDVPELDLSDPRGILYKGRQYLSSVSHLRVARSRDGFHFAIDPKPTVVPSTPYEVYGVEDPRITPIDGAYYVSYTAVSPMGVCVPLLRTTDFVHFERLGVIFPPENKNVVLFPDRSSGRYAAFHRPAGSAFGSTPDIWLAYSPDLLHWGDHRRLMGTRAGMWDAGRIGGGAVPIETPKGWLAIYHGAVGSRYCLGTVLLDRDAPHRVLGRSVDPIMTPIEPYERAGFFGSVVFTCGAVRRSDDEVLVYYGAGDSTLGVAMTSVSELLETVEPVSALTAA